MYNDLCRSLLHFLICFQDSVNSPQQQPQQQQQQQQQSQQQPQQQPQQQIPVQPQTVMPTGILFFKP